MESRVRATRINIPAPVFDGTGFSNWKRQMERHLVYVHPKMLNLVQMEVTTLREEYTPELGDSLAVRKRKQDGLQELEELEATCVALLSSTLSGAPLELTLDCESAKEIWDTLCERYESKSLQHRLLVGRKLNNMRYKPGQEKFVDYCTRFDALLRESREAGAVVDDTENVLKFVLSLPADYESLTASWTGSATSPTPTMSSVRTAIEEFEEARQHRRKTGQPSSSAVVSPGSAFSARGGRGGSNHYRGHGRPSPYASTSRGCSNCGHLSHHIKDCYKPGGGAYQGWTRGRGRGGFGFGSNQKTAPSFEDAGRGRGGFRGGRGRGSYRGGRGGFTTNNQQTASLASEGQQPKEETASQAAIVKSVGNSMVSIANIILVHFLLDSGASAHMVTTKMPVVERKRLTVPVKIKIAKSNLYLFAYEEGEIIGTVEANGILREIKINVLVVENLSQNLLSITKLEQQGYEITFFGGVSTIKYQGELMAQGKIGPGLHELTISVSSPVGESSLLTVEENVWHKRLGHLNVDYLRKLSTMVDDMGKYKFNERELCETCVAGKQQNNSFSGTRPRTVRVLQRVHSDLCGPITPVAFNGDRYFMTFIDDFSHFVIVFGLKRKSEAAKAIKNYVAMVTTKFPGLQIEKFRCDNGSEYFNSVVKDFFAENGTQFEPSNPYTPQQNGVAERMNRTLLEKARCMLLECQLNKSFWIEAIKTSAYLLNRSPTRGLPEEVLPFQVWNGCKPSFSNLKVFGCICLARKPDAVIVNKMEERSKRCIFLGYGENGFRLWSIGENKVIFSKHVVFDESKFKFQTVDSWVHSERELELKVGNPDDDDDDNVDGENEVVEVRELVPGGDNTSENEDEGAVHDNVREENLQVEEFDDNTGGEVRRGTRVRVKPRHLEDYATMAMVSQIVVNLDDDKISEISKIGFDVKTLFSELEIVHNDCELALSALNVCNNVPQTFEELQGRDDKELWMGAVDEELNSLKENETWELVTLPNGRIPIKCKWVFTVKEDGDGNVNRYKARLVIKGCSQKRGIDYHETYAPVARLSTVRVLLSLINKFKMFVSQLDVKNAFLNGVLREEIYMCPPEGLEVPNDSVCKLKRTLYGLKQAPMEWNARFDEFVKRLGFQQCSADKCMYVLHSNNCRTYLLLYVDDFLLACTDNRILLELKSRFMREFKMRDLGEMSYFLGIKITRCESGIFLSQENYLRKVLAKHKMDLCAPVKTPLEPQPCSEVNSNCIIGNKPYREVIGSLMYACMATRPDICVAVNFYSQFQTNATEEQWKGIKRILRYIKGTLDWGIWFKSNNCNSLLVFADADYANHQNRKSISGFILDVYGDTVLWGTRKQTFVALSTTEAEFVALAVATAEALWLKQLLKELNVSVSSIKLFEDNQSCISALSSWEVKRLKHMDIKYNFVKDLWRKGLLCVEYLPSSEQKADLMTKGLPADIFNKHRISLGMCSRN